ncbi:uncharacterized protein TNCV_464261 [Trichonephila clavipes]|nr:uncharacterized protein TNCV_464261 [Trichonephila clavipes]
MCRERSLQGSEHQDQKRRAPEQRQGVKRSIPSSISSRNYKFKRPNTSSQGVESIAGPSRLLDRIWSKSTTVGSRTEGSGRDNQTSQTRATTRGRKAERPVRSNQATTRRLCPYYLRSRLKESDGIPEEQRHIEINGIPHSKIRRRSLSMEALDGDPKYDACRRQIYRPISAKKNRRNTAQQVANQFLAASGKQISRKTVARRLRGEELTARRPVVCVPLTRQQRTARLQWCREHHNWTELDWACVLFSDESRFSLSSDCRRQLIWRESGTAYRPEKIQEKDRYPTCSIMVWAGIMINGRTRLHVVANGTMTG